MSQTEGQNRRGKRHAWCQLMLERTKSAVLWMALPTVTPMQKMTVVAMLKTLMVTVPSMLTATMLLTVTMLLTACDAADHSAIDQLNDEAYAWHYRSLDSTEHYARRALQLSATEGGSLIPSRTSYADGQAEALNNLAFARIVRMHYGEAERLLDSIPSITDNQLELLVADVQQMRLCQRRSHNREFYDHRERAVNALKRINEERDQLNERQQKRLLYAESELAVVTSTYYYYVGLEQNSIEALGQVPDNVEQDTAQFLNYLYNVGAGGILTNGSQEDIRQQEFDFLLRCFQIARQHAYPFFAANALEAMAEHLMEPEGRQQLIDDNAPGLKLVNPEEISDEQLPVWLADNSLATFREYGDVYQIAGAYRTLASCHRAMGDHESALFNLEQALSDTLIYQAPDLVASIREQLSVAYAAINDKPNSDRNRNMYLDLQEQTRQDRQLEARADQLDRAVSQLNWMLFAVVMAIALLVFFLWLFNDLNQKQKRKQNNELDDLLEQRREQLAVSRLHLEDAERANLDQRAKVSMVVSILPLIDRMVHANATIDHSSLTIDHSDAHVLTEANGQWPMANGQWQVAYIRELIDQIEADNEVLTHWIQLQQGQLSLHIESFPLQPLFDIVERGKMGFQMKGISFSVEPTPAVVKADRILTLFMLNTLADNARKFTAEGGCVSLLATETADYVEISVSDTGAGMSADELAHVFDRTTIKDDQSQVSHGFGLLNCKGIIDKYRKLSQIFSVCTLQAESRQGVGSRFWFRLPRGVVKTIACGLLATTATLMPLASPATTTPPAGSHDGTAVDTIGVASASSLGRASIYADSAYFSNINGTYARTLVFADSCRKYLNDYYLSVCPGGNDLMLDADDGSPMVAELKWLHDSLPTNYNIILDMRNETAVAALSLHQWQRYTYNNRIYIQLFKELSADNTLGDYCRTMQQSQTNRTIAVILLIMVALAILPAYYLLYYRHRLNRRFQQEQLLQDQLETLDDELRRTEMELQNLHVSNAILDNCLSTLKHETMYYPSRIRQLVNQGDTQSMGEVTAYYRELYSLLSQQAMRQTEHTKLHLQELDDHILGDPTLIGYLFDLLKKQSGQKQLSKSVSPKGEKYVEVRVPMPGLRLSEAEARQLFTPAISHIPYLLCRQIVRDHGEATNRRGCSISAETADGLTTVTIVLPRRN